MSDKDCVFCKIAKGEIGSAKVYEDGEVLAFLDIKPINAGHTLVIPKKHYDNLMDLPQAMTNKMMAVVKKITPAILKAVGTNSFNLGVNNGALAGQSVNHAHFHIIPRIQDDGLELWGGRGDYSEKESQELLAKIKENLN